MRNFCIFIHLFTLQFWRVLSFFLGNRNLACITVKTFVICLFCSLILILFFKHEASVFFIQKNVLFSGTIEENLQWGDENAGKDQIRKAAESAQAEGFIQKLADGYDTELGQGGVNVSGGQKQRLCIARALLKRPKILILDDSTSAVDTATEAKIREAFSTTLKETTKLIIAQRIGSVMEADQIVVMDEGKIVGLGKHEDLLETCKAYQEIYDSQMKKEVIA